MNYRLYASDNRGYHNIATKEKIEQIIDILDGYYSDSCSYDKFLIIRNHNNTDEPIAVLYKDNVEDYLSFKSEQKVKVKRR